MLREGNAEDEGAIREWLLERLPKWQTPDRILFIEAIPRTGVGKFLKRDLRARYDTLFAEEPG